MRGAPERVEADDAVAGLIPARAGNTPVTARAVQPKRAHPRSRGEHVPLRITKKERMGSSPLARGTPRGFVERSGLVGLIPARAGNTMGLTSSSYAARAHPRSRGEHPRITPRAAASGGSSPLARGTQSHSRCGERRPGLIPARAGNTPGSFTARQWSRAHPRSRGEHPAMPAIRFFAGGSSPLARGTQLEEALGDAECGLIPARAGNTPALSPPATQPRAHPRSRGEHSQRDLLVP